MRYAYEILTPVPGPNPGNPSWVIMSNHQNTGPDLLRTLNQMGASGWEGITVGQLGGDVAGEILLKRVVSP